jgi:leader peptidase (prepilin peptidase)/N-methyltransferase
MRNRIAFALVGALAFLAGGAAHGAPPLVLAQLSLAGAALTAAAAADLTERRIPNRLVLPATAACATLALAAGVSAGAIVGGLAIVVVLAALALARPEALGMGDVKLALLVAVALGGRATPALLLGLVLAALAGVALLCLRGRPALASAIPLAPFICLGSFASLLP